MEREEINGLITSAAKTIFTYCRVRTNSKEEAEDLSQDILFQLLKTKGSFQNEKAFNSFMWVVASNVYKDWCKKRKKNIEHNLDENISDNSIPLADLLENELDLSLLYRELCLLTEQYSKVIIQYYFHGLKVSEISKSQNLSESMVKFLLFKARKILKEGMNMEREKGDFSFNPGKMQLQTWGEMDVSLQAVCNDSLIAQNILLTCYNDRCTAEEISLQIGVAVPYLERDLKNLCENNILIQKGSKYETAVVIFTAAFSEEADRKTLPIQNNLANIIGKFLSERIADIKSVGFHTGVTNDNLLRWHIAAVIIVEAFIVKYQASINQAYPTNYPTHLGKKMFVYGIEDFKSRYGDHWGNAAGNANHDTIALLDFAINGEWTIGYFKYHQNRVNIALDIAKGKSTGFSENDMNEVADFIKLGIVKKTGDKLSLNIPVFTNIQYKEILSLIDDVTTAIVEETKEYVKITTDILIQHTPVKMKKEAEAIGFLKLKDAINASVGIMVDNSILQLVDNSDFPTTHIILT